MIDTTFAIVVGTCAMVAIVCTYASYYYNRKKELEIIHDAVKHRCGN